MLVPGSFSFDHVDTSDDEHPSPSLTLAKGAIHQRRRARSDAKLRIVIICENIMPRVDGVTRTLSRLLQHLDRNGHQALVLCPETPLKEYCHTQLIGTAGIPLVVYPELKLNFLRPTFLRAIEQFDPDVIHIVDPIWLGAQMLWALQLGWAGPPKPIIASYHTNIPTYLGFFGFGFLEELSWDLLRGLHKGCLLTACPSRSTAAMLASRDIGNGGKTLRIWPRGVDTEIFNPRKRRVALRWKWGKNSCEEWRDLAPLPTPPPSPGMAPADFEMERCMILYVGRISHEKNLFFLIHAFSNLRRQLRDLALHPRMILVGHGPARSKLEELVTQLNLGDDIIFEGHIGDHAKLAEYYASADIFAFPSYTETFGQVVCEALASGLPVVGLDAPGTRDLVVHDETGLLLSKPRGNAGWNTLLQNKTIEDPIFRSLVSQYSMMLEPLVRNYSKRKVMGLRASQEGIQGRSWHNAMESIVGCYREAIASPSGSTVCDKNAWQTRCILFVGFGLYLACRFVWLCMDLVL